MLQHLLTDLIFYFVQILLHLIAIESMIECHSTNDYISRSNRLEMFAYKIAGTWIKENLPGYGQGVPEPAGWRKLSSRLSWWLWRTPHFRSSSVTVNKNDFNVFKTCVTGLDRFTSTHVDDIFFQVQLAKLSREEVNCTTTDRWKRTQINTYKSIKWETINVYMFEEYE